MTPQEIIENNRKIAEFMGYKEQTDPSKRWLGQWFDPTTGERHVYLLFNTSWDWLMPVIQHIGQETGWTMVMEEATSYWVNSGEYACDEQQFGGYGDIDNIFEAVVDFIDWYNSQNLDPDGNPACKVYKGETVLPNEDGKCSLCEGDCTEQ